MSGIGGPNDDIVFSGYHPNNWGCEGVTRTDIVSTFSFKENVLIAQNPGHNKLKLTTVIFGVQVREKIEVIKLVLCATKSTKIANPTPT